MSGWSGSSAPWLRRRAPGRRGGLRQGARRGRPLGDREGPCVRSRSRSAGLEALAEEDGERRRRSSTSWPGVARHAHLRCDREPPPPDTITTPKPPCRRPAPGVTVKRRDGPQPVVGDLPAAGLSQKQARSIKHRMTITRRPSGPGRPVDRRSTRRRPRGLASGGLSRAAARPGPGRRHGRRRAAPATGPKRQTLARRPLPPAQPRPLSRAVRQARSSIGGIRRCSRLGGHRHERTDPRDRQLAGPDEAGRHRPDPGLRRSTAGSRDCEATRAEPRPQFDADDLNLVL